jgi:hypothetical protein
MSAKSTEASDDRIPSYEESIAATPSLQSQRAPSSAKSTTSFQQRIKEQRQRKIADLLLNSIEPAIARNIDDATNDFTLILIASDAFPTSASVATSSITSPYLIKPTNLVPLSGDDYRSNFITSWTVVQELSDTLIRSMIDPSILPQLQAQLPQLSSSSETSLPARPLPKSWLKRAFGMPPADHDPTGQTGKWNLGWRSEDNAALNTRTITTSDIVLTAKLADVTFRTESPLGLLESTTVKCLCLDLLLRI